MNKKIFILIATLLIVFIFMWKDKVKTQSQAKPVSEGHLPEPTNESEKINKYLQEIEFNKKAQAIKTGQDIGHQDIKLDDDSDSDELLKQDLNAGSGFTKENDTVSLGDQIEAEKIRMQSEFETIESPTDAYVQQFIENARKDGLIIKVDKNNQIIDIKKIAE